MIIKDRKKLPRGMLTDTIYTDSTDIEGLGRMLVTEISRDVSAVRDGGVQVEYSVSVSLNRMPRERKIGDMRIPAEPYREDDRLLILFERIDNAEDIEGVLVSLGLLVDGFKKFRKPLDKMDLEMGELRDIAEREAQYE